MTRQKRRARVLGFKVGIVVFLLGAGMSIKIGFRASERGADPVSFWWCIPSAFLASQFDSAATRFGWNRGLASDASIVLFVVFLVMQGGLGCVGLAHVIARLSGARLVDREGDRVTGISSSPTGGEKSIPVDSPEGPRGKTANGDLDSRRGP